MLPVKKRFRDVLSSDKCLLAANIFDPLSARIADILGYQVCVLSGSVGKVANLGVPDIVLSNMSDVVDHCRRITRMTDVSLMVDAEDGFGNAVNVARTVRDLENAGVCGIEIEDNVVPREFNVTNPGLVSTEEQVGKLRAAVAAKRDPDTVIVARTSALSEVSLDEALSRIKAYSDTGAEALMLVGAKRGKEDISAVHKVTSLPICVLSPPTDTRDDSDFLDANGVRILMLGNPTFAVAVQAIYDSLAALNNGIKQEELTDRMASSELLREVNKTDEYLNWQLEYRNS